MQRAKIECTSFRSFSTAVLSFSKSTSSKGQERPDCGKPPLLTVSSCQSCRRAHFVGAMSVVVQESWEVCIVVKTWLHPAEHMYMYIYIFRYSSYFCLKILTHGIPLAESQRVQRHLGSLKGSWGYYGGPALLQPYCTMTGGDNNSSSIVERRRKGGGGMKGKGVMREKRQTSSIPEHCAHFHLCVFLKAFPQRPMFTEGKAGFNLFIYLVRCVASTSCSVSDTKHL